MQNDLCRSVLLLMIVVLSSRCTAQIGERLEPQVFKEKIDNEGRDYVILDVRTDAEVAEGIVPGAKQFDFYSDNFKSKIDKLDKEVTYYIYCRSGNRSGKALSLMGDLGFKKVYEMQGGMNAWKAAGLAVE